MGSRSLELAMSQYNYDDVLSYVTGCIRCFKPLVAVTQDLNGEYGHGGHMLFAKAVYDAIDISSDNNSYPESATLYGTWDVLKTYFHLYQDNQISLNLSVPLANMGGRTAIQVAQDAYEKHISQHKWDFAITDSGNATTGSAAYSCSTFGLYRSLVGSDTSNDMLLLTKNRKGLQKSVLKMNHANRHQLNNLLLQRRIIRIIILPTAHQKEVHL